MKTDIWTTINIVTIYVLIIIIISSIGIGIATADGIDDPNFYQDFDYCMETTMTNQSQSCRKYDKIGKPSYNRDRFVYIPDSYDESLPIKQVRDVPEPSSLAMIAVTVGLVIMKKVKGEF